MLHPPPIRPEPRQRPRRPLGLVTLWLRVSQGQIDDPLTQKMLNLLLQFGIHDFFCKLVNLPFCPSDSKSGNNTAAFTFAEPHAIPQHIVHIGLRDGRVEITGHFLIGFNRFFRCCFRVLFHVDFPSGLRPVRCLLSFGMALL